ncbi:MAG: hypothetical protein JXA11_05930 [Phycisphaerae bacterium]|nr:hypothetical protein [Phycisphaerae bacterium]
MRRTVAICFLIAICAGFVIAGGMEKPAVQNDGSFDAAQPIAQAQAGSAYLLELSTMGLLGVGAVSLFVCRRRKRT